MRVLAVTYSNRRPNNDQLYDTLAEHVELSRMRIDRTQAMNIGKTLAPYNLLSYDRIILELRAKHAIKRWRDLWKVPNLIFYEEDTWQNYVSFSKNQGLFARYYTAAQPKMILHSGYTVAKRTAELGFNSRFLPKGFDANKLSNTNSERNIELGFVGRTEHSNYVLRKALLLELQRTDGLQLLRTNSDSEYLDTLNAIKYFISADIEFGEHMIKNFEAMACGCVLFAYRQGADDAELGLIDMETAVLYSSTEELREKLQVLRKQPDLSKAIAEKGQKLAQSNHGHDHLGNVYADLLFKDLPPPGKHKLAKPHHADIEMSEEFFRSLEPADDVADTRIAENNVRYQFFDRSGLSSARKLRNSALHDLSQEDIVFWGRYRPNRQYWVAFRKMP